MAKKGTTTTTRYRSSITGKFVSNSYGKSHPKTTVKETIKIPKK